MNAERASKAGRRRALAGPPAGARGYGAGRETTRGSDRVDFLNASEVAATFEFGREPDFHNVQGLGFGHGTLAKGEAVAVIVSAVPDCDLFVPTQAAADALHAVGDDGFAVARAAEDDAALVFAAGDGFGGGPDKIRVVAAGVGLRTKVTHCVALSEEQGFNGFFVSEAGVVGADGDGEQFHGERQVTGDGEQDKSGGGSDDVPEGGGVGQICEEGVGGVHSELCGRVGAGSDSDYVGPDHAGAGDVVRSVTNNPRARRGKLDTSVGVSAAEGVGSELVAELAVVGEGTEGKVVPQTVVAEFRAGAALDVAGEQALGDVGTCAGGGQECAHARKDAGVGIGELGGQFGEVAVEETGKVFLGGGQPKFPKDAPHNPAVGAASEIDVLEGAVDREGAEQRGAQRAHAGAAGGDEGTIDIPKQKCVHGKA